MPIKKVNVSKAFTKFDDLWSPKLAGVINDFGVKLVKVRGEFVWHHHDEEDELFYVIEGQLRIELRDQDSIVLDAGEFVIIPRGVEHRPVAEEACQLLLFERSDMRNTGNVEGDLTADIAWLSDEEM